MAVILHTFGVQVGSKSKSGSVSQVICKGADGASRFAHPKRGQLQDFVGNPKPPQSPNLAPESPKES